MSNTDKPKQTFKQMMTAECRMMRDRLKETGIIDWAVHKEVVRQWINENCIPKSEVEDMKFYVDNYVSIKLVVEMLDNYIADIGEESKPYVIDYMSKELTVEILEELKAKLLNKE